MVDSNFILKNDLIRGYIKSADKYLNEIGFTEHGFAHVNVVANNASNILKELGYDEHIQDMSKIACYMHDIGNTINRVNHAEYGATMSFKLLSDLNMPVEDLTSIISAIGNHDEHTGNPVSPISAALIIADKSDVRRSRVRKRDVNIFDIHDRVNYSIYEAKLEIDHKLSEIVLNLKLDTDYCSVIEYFEIFVGRMKMCMKAANYLGVTFSIKINGVKMM